MVVGVRSVVPARRPQYAPRSVPEDMLSEGFYFEKNQNFEPSAPHLQNSEPRYEPFLNFAFCINFSFCAVASTSGAKADLPPELRDIADVQTRVINPAAATSEHARLFIYQRLSSHISMARAGIYVGFVQHLECKHLLRRKLSPCTSFILFFPLTFLSFSNFTRNNKKF